VGIVHIFYDISKRVQAEKEIEKQRSLLDEVVLDVREGMGIVDENERILFCNPAFAGIFDTNAESLVGRNLVDFFDEKSREIIRKQTETRMAGEATTYELPCTTAKGNVKYLRVTASPRFREDGSYAGTFGVVIDITAKNRADEVYHGPDAKHSTTLQETVEGGNGRRTRKT
jgi:PAS domain S-box-containing protein